MSGPLSGIKIVEFAGIGPGPMCAMLLAEMGADVLRIERQADSGLGLKRPRKLDLLLRSRGNVAIDLKQPEGLELALELVEQADGLIEGFRPGVMERLGLGPQDCAARNPRLVYGRITGWGQSGPLAKAAGHDLNYVALTGVVNGQGRAGEAPFVPINLVGDFGGGALYLAMGLLAGIIDARTSGRGQVVDAAIVDGVASVQTGLFGMVAAGMWGPDRGTNAIDGGSHFVQVYECADGKWVSVAAVEGKFHALLLEKLGLSAEEVGDQMALSNWPRARALLAERFRTRSQAQWRQILEGTDACFAPVLSWQEMQDHPHLRERRTIVEVDGVKQPAPAPRFSRTPGPAPYPPQEITAQTADRALRGWLPDDRVEALRAARTII